MRKYKMLGKRARFEAENDQVAAVAVAITGDFGFTDRQKLDRFPAAWNEQEWGWYLEEPLSDFRKGNAEAIKAALASIA